MITGSTAASESFPSHIWYQMKVKSTEMMQLDFEHVPQVLGWFGWKEEQVTSVDWPKQEGRGGQ